MFYWEPAWITVGDITGKTGDELQAQIDANRVKWETYGSGWATSFAADYDDYYAENYGGSKVDNQAMFYSDGTPTAALNVWNYVNPNFVRPYSITDVIPTDSGFNISVMNIPRRATIIVALYDGTDKMLNAAFSQLNPEAEVQSVDMEKPDDTAAVKVFIWDSLEGMKPLATSPQK